MRFFFLALALLASFAGQAAVLGVYTADGQFLGRLNGRDGYSYYVSITTPKGYLVVLRDDGVAAWTVSYKSPTPEFTAYTDASCTTLVGRTDEAGIVIRPYLSATRSGRVLSVASDAVRIPTNTPLFEASGGACTPHPYFATTKADEVWLPISPNDPAVTGIGDGPFASPLRYKMLHGDWIQGSTFDSGYEASEAVPRDD